MSRAVRRGWTAVVGTAGALVAVLLPCTPALAGDRVGEPPLRWPSAVAAASHGSWLVGYRPDAPLPPGVKGQARVLRPGTLSVPSADARRIGRSLAKRGLLQYAEPDVTMTRASAPEAAPGAWARGAVVSPSLGWPAGGAEIAVLDDFVDASSPDLAGHVRYLNATPASRIEGSHGTAVASAASAAADGQGLLGVMPGAPIASYGFPASIRCSEVVTALEQVRDQDIPIVNLSFGSTESCFSMYVAVQAAFGSGTLVVASAGNEYDLGNPVVYPAAYPHVVSVAAVDGDLSSAYFSTANLAVDVSAPGVAVPVNVPPEFDVDDGVQDGYTTVDGTSFAAPMVAGAASWVLAVRDQLSTGQLADVLRYSSRDIGEAGYDDDTGWGLVDVAAALAAPTPRDDVLEPNDDVAFVNGSVFGRPDRAIWRGRGSRSLSASADRVEDPLDVYRFRMPARSRAVITLSHRRGDADLAVYNGSARYIGHARARVCRSVRALGATDRCRLELRSRRPAWGYVAVDVADSDEGIAADYVLRLRRR